MNKTAELKNLVEGITKARSRFLAKAITLLESSLQEDKVMALELLEQLWALVKKNKPALCLGICGAPGVGKSTFIESLALAYLKLNPSHRIAILTIDPSSSIHGGSLLGDKTRMSRLIEDSRIYIRPSADGGHDLSGGISSFVVDAITVFEAASFELVLIESVGIGQSEVKISQVVDSLILLHLPQSGDELQAMKKGLLEYVDQLIVHKADGILKEKAMQCVPVLKNILRIPVFAISSVDLCEGLEDFLLELMTGFKINESKRALQREYWFEEKFKLEMFSLLKQVIGEEKFNKKFISFQAKARSGVKPPRVVAHEFCDLLIVS